MPKTSLRRAPWAMLLAAAAVSGSGCATLGRPEPRYYSAEIRSFPSPPGTPDAPVYLAAVKQPQAARFPVALYLDGSECRSVVHLMYLFQPLVEQGYAVVAPEKRGVKVGDKGEACSPEFLEHDTRQEREREARVVIARLSEVLPGWNGKLLVVAMSEGTSFAPAVARATPAVRGLVLLSGGDGWTQGREVLALEDDRLRARGATDQERKQAEAALRAQMDAIRRGATPDAMWLGHPHRRWASYLDYDPLPELLALDIPIYLAKGGRDASSPVESARAAVKAFADHDKRNLVSREYPGLDHGFSDAEGRNHFPEVARDLLGWIRSLDLTASP